ncbi:MAG: glycosyltransferase family 2 protein [Bacteroidia bacterium]
MQQPEISVVIPVYRAEKIVDELLRQLHAELQKISPGYEIILVDDRSPDNGWERMIAGAANDSRVKCVRLSRNFGQHYALTAGLSYARGKYVVTMDCDLQDDPAYIQKLYDKIKEGFGIVYTSKARTGHGLFKNIFAGLYFRIYNWLSDSGNTESDDIGSFLIMQKKVVDAFLSVNDYHRHYLLILKWLGFSSDRIRIEHRKRFEGKSSYTFTKLVSHALNGITSQSVKLLHLSVSIGFTIFLLSLILGFAIIVKYFISGYQQGWTSIFVLILFSTGLMMMSIGVSGIYLGKTFEQSKQRPLFIVDEEINISKNE